MTEIINIPAGVLEAMQKSCLRFLPLPMWETAMRAGLKAWPDMCFRHRPNDPRGDQPAILLPLEPPTPSEEPPASS